MERFAIKIDKSVKARLKNLCRLCGIDNPNQIEILNAAEWIDLTIEGEVSLSRKIAECVGIEVMKNDRMPQRICALCIDKINDFYEFREMCQATNVQTRKLLSLPEVTKVKAPKKVTIKTEEDAVESILGISDSGLKAKAEPVPKAGKKAKKGATTSTAIAPNDSNRFRGMTKREIEITLELERIKKEEEEEEQKPKQTDNKPAARTNNGKKRKEKANGKKSLDAPLLAPKEPNQRERKREMEQKRLEKKRKADTKIKTPLPKKIKKEPGISCSICDTRFEKVAYRDAHLSLEHRPLIVDYGCPSCQEQFATLEETTAHNGWHWKTNVPFKCVICDATFPKLITFQKHLSSCVHPSFALTAPFAGNIYCSICKSEFETQNLYDWHRCFISDNSPCPHCSRVFVKRTVLIKHMFRCTGPPGAAPVAPKKVKGKAKKKTAKGAQKVKNRLDIPPQNSFKFEPETIIEQNIDGEDAFDAMDESFMDTHFADSDNEFEPMNSIIPSTELAVDQGEPTKEPMNEGTTNANVNEIAANDVPDVGIRANLSHPLLECRVKLEPLDVSNLTTPTITVHPEPVVSQSQPQLTVPPLTIRIKKEVIRPGYGDEFDISLARNIKQERVDETYELASTSTSTHRSKHGAHKKSINPEKQKKLYKKPALLAIKIKQERMERETTDDDCNDSYQDYSMPSDDFSVVTGNQSFEATNSLPIITQIHSVIGPSAIVPMANDQLIDQQMPIATNSSETSQQTNNVPFMPIRIKSEFQRPLSPPPAINSEATQQLDENVATANVSDCVESTMMPDITINETGNENNEPENEPEHIDKEPETEVTSTEPQPMECDTSSTLNFDTNLQPSSMVDDVTTLETGKSDDNNITEIENETQPIENMNVAESFVPPQFSGENVASEQNLDENCDKEIILPQNEFLPEQQETTDELFENGQCGDEVVTTNTVENMLVNHETVENEQSIDSMSQHSMNSLDKHLDILSASGHDVDKSEQMLLPIEPPICDDNIAMDTDVTNDNSNISPIDFIEPNTNDDSLNFIDQLVHEVADTMVEQTSDAGRIDTQNDGIPIDTSNMPFEATNFNYSIGCIASAIGNVVDPSPEMHRDESNSKPIENVEKPAADDTLLTLSDIPDIDYDLLPVLNEMEPKSNGNELNTCPPLDSNPTTDEEIANIMQTDAKGDNNQPNSQINE